MSSVAAPKTSYKPRLPRDVIEKGLLSAPQLEFVVTAGEAHSQMLPAPEGETARRKGTFNGDGTGVGKGRQIAGVILDNWQQGRTKAVWVSENSRLMNDALRDWKGLGQDPALIFNLQKTKNGDSIKSSKGIAFVSYDTLKGGMSQQASLSRIGFAKKQPVIVNNQSGVVQKIEAGSRGQSAQITVRLDNGTTVTVPMNEVKSAPGSFAVKTRLDQLVEWVGKDFDGVIAFDEAHNMGNLGGEEGARGNKEAAQKAIAGQELQTRLPNARVLYFSATGATEVANLAYADRLGLWGRGTPFASKERFVSEVSGGGIAAMELVARDIGACRTAALG